MTDNGFKHYETYPETPGTYLVREHDEDVCFEAVIGPDKTPYRNGKLMLIYGLEWKLVKDV